MSCNNQEKKCDHFVLIFFEMIYKSHPKMRLFLIIIIIDNVTIEMTKPSGVFFILNMINSVNEWI